MASIYWISTASTSWAIAANWSTTTVPANGDDVYITNSAISIDTGLNQSAVTLASLSIDSSYTGRLGTSAAALQVSATTMTIGQEVLDGQTTGSGRLRIDGTFTTVNVLNTATNGADIGFPPCRLKGTITTLNVLRGKVGIAVSTPVETSTVTTLNGNKDNAAAQPIITLGNGVTVTTINIKGSKVVTRNSATITAVTLYDGSYSVQGDAAHTTLTMYGGAVQYMGIGTITNLRVYGGTFDLSMDGRTKTVSNCDLYGPCTLDVATGVAGSVVFTNGIDLNGIDFDDAKVMVGENRRITLGTVA